MTNPSTDIPLTPGQVVGGRWRPLQYFFQQSVYADVMATCGADGACYIKNDAHIPFVGEYQITELQLTGDGSQPMASYVEKVELPA